MDNREIRMVALDLDGTTLDTDSKISRRTCEALHAAMKQGVHIVVSTGRGFDAVPEEIFHVDGLEYIITSNGANVRKISSRDTIYENHVAAEATVDVIKILRNSGISVEAVVDGVTYIDEKEYTDIVENGSSYRSVNYVVSTRKPVPDIFEYIYENRGHIENINIIFENLEQKMNWKNVLESIPKTTLTTSFSHNFEIGGETTSKAEALRFLMHEVGVTRNQLMACGDSHNDSEMIKFAEIGVAMGNASDDLKAVADYVTDSNGEDGVAKAIEKFVLK